MTTKQDPTATAPEIMTMAEAHELSRLSLRTLGRMAERGEFRAVRVGRRWLINRESFLAMLAGVL